MGAIKNCQRANQGYDSEAGSEGISRTAEILKLARFINAKYLMTS